MKSTIMKTTVREIQESLGRYMAILAIVALGVGLYVGLTVTKPDMVAAGENYLEENKLYDLRLVSTIGYDDEAVKSLNAQEDVEIAEGEVYTDFLAVDENGEESVLRAHSMLWKLNQTVVTAGRKPTAGNECMVDAQAYGKAALGSTIRVSENNDEDTADMFRYTEYTVVGLCNSSYYINYERGTTALGSGRLKGFVYIPKDGFDTDYYTDVYVFLKDRYGLYSEEYDDAVEAAEDWAEPLGEELAQERYLALKEDAEWQIEEGERELAEKKAEAEEEFADARQELLDAEAEIADAQKEIDDGWAELADARQEIADNRGTLADSRAELLDGQTQLADGKEELADSRTQAADLDDEDERKNMEAGLNLAQAQLQGNEAQLEAGLGLVNMGQAQLTYGEEQISRNEKRLKDAEEELADAREELADGWEEYEENLNSFEEQIADAEEELADARAELADLEEPDSYVLTRNENIGYACYESDSSIIEGIAGVFPVFFFLVAALVCMTTMARMVEEQRTQIGVLKALGYARGRIMGKYLFYSGSAALLGCLIGFFAGSWLFPTVIWFAYGIMYQMGDFVILLDWRLGAVSLLVSVLCSMGTTFVTCRYELADVAAQLMRPKAPKNGKRIFLEKIPFLWNHMSFLVKVSARNIFRYKQRFFMMVFGIGGCTALLLTGFGVKDSISGIIDNQYGEIQINDLNVIFSDAYTQKNRSEFEEIMGQTAAGYTLAFEESADLGAGEETESVTLVIPQNPDEMGDYLSLHTEKGESVSWPGEGEVVLTAKLAGKSGLETGDETLIKDEDGNSLRVIVSGISENYIYNYAYLSPETWRSQTGGEAEYQTAYVNVKEGQDIHEASAAIMNCSGVASVTAYEDMQTRFGSMMESMDYVVLVIIVCAGALAFIVLYNLTNINITERLREIATIKVLGFYRNETASYVFRENLILTGLGALAGLVMGKYLHSFVMSQIDIDMITFDVRIAPLSIVYSIILTFVFALFVCWVMNRKLDAINMAESMKSIE
ncbi:MAG TPA: FtsX-like permease family protein [Candidatus Eisenbergiella merdavium]|uniref:FtsX-like permease family protein n=1 Tax=Candidatus Eisenbergiella merdavium TaxID=2838551 RepID=A0A9D2NGA6_9FIRM|nr:FtsX-like permease family protein [Candidatus Eisenbergiella merdavium]